MERSSLNASLREGKGKEAAIKFRQQGMIPAVLYGPKTDPLKLILNPQDLQKAISTEAGENTLIDLSIEGKKARVVLLRELQVDPISREYLHADLYEVPLDRKIHLMVHVTLTGQSVGVKEGGILDQIMREVEVSCLPTQIPDQLQVDVSELKIGGTVHLKDVALPEGVDLVMDPEMTLATVLAPRIEEVAVPPTAEEEAVEPEVEGKKPREEKPEEEKEAKEKEGKEG